MSLEGKNTGNDSVCTDGLFIPVWGTDWTIGQRAGRGFLYLVILVYLFVGISIIADKFMESIEVITSQEKEVHVRDKLTGNKKVLLVRVWNETVANLTLMALGSSAPEILLSVIEITGNDFNAGSLGPGTIIGSAAFNLFVILGICIAVVPEGEIRKIKHTYVFFVTAFWSIFAYVWLYLILAVFSPDRIEPWEGIMTLVFFFLVVLTAYLAEKKMFYRRWSKKLLIDNHQDDLRVTDEDDISELDEFHDTRIAYIEALKKMRLHFPTASVDELEPLAMREVLTKAPKTRAFYRMYSSSIWLGKISFDEKLHQYMQQLSSNLPLIPRSDESFVTGKDALTTQIYFCPHHYKVFEDEEKIEVCVAREGEDTTSVMQVEYFTENGTALEGKDYVQQSGTITFEQNETRQFVTIEILNDDVFDEDSHFYVHLKNPRFYDGREIPYFAWNDDEHPSLKLGHESVATIVILDDDHGGIFDFTESEMSVSEAIGHLEVNVSRTHGAKGNVEVTYQTVDGTAMSGKDFQGTKGSLIFTNGEIEKKISVQIFNRDCYEKKINFSLKLGDAIPLRPTTSEDGIDYSQILSKSASDLTDQEKVALQGRPKLGNISAIEITIRESREFKNAVDRMIRRGNASMILGASSWKEQLKEAITYDGTTLKVTLVPLKF